MGYALRRFAAASPLGIGPKVPAYGEGGDPPENVLNFPFKFIQFPLNYYSVYLNLCFGEKGNCLVKKVLFLEGSQTNQGHLGVLLGVQGRGGRL